MTKPSKGQDGKLARGRGMRPKQGSSPAGGRRASNVLVAALVLGGMVGCSSDNTDAADSTAEPTVTAIPVIADSITVQLPLDQFLPSPQQNAQLQAAYRTLLRQCVARFGRQYAPPGGSTPDSDRGLNARRYGVTNPDEVAVYGYHPPPDIGVRKEPQQEIPTDVETILSGKGPRTIGGKAVPAGGCVAQARTELNNGQAAADDSLAQRLSSESFARSQADSRVRAAVSRWVTCMHGKGFDYSTPANAIGDPRFQPGGTVSALEISTAKADVQCKKQVNLVGVWSAVESAYQVRLINQNQAALDAIRTARDQQMKAAARLAALP